MPNAHDNPRIRPVRVLLADDHPLYSETLALVLAADDRIDVVGAAEDGYQAVDLARRLRPDVVLMDVRMPGMNGIEASRTLQAELPGVRVVMLSSSAAVEDVERARDAGAWAYLTKDTRGASIAEELVYVSSAPAAPTARRAA